MATPDMWRRYRDNGPLKEAELVALHAEVSAAMPYLSSNHREAADQARADMRRLESRIITAQELPWRAER